jgi:type II secretory pathway pseudopilin PulG
MTMKVLMGTIDSRRARTRCVMRLTDRCPHAVGKPHGDSDSRSGRRRGSLLLETVIASILLSTAIGILMPVLMSMKQQRLHHRFEALALVELQNLADRLRHDSAEPAALSDWFLDRYGTAELLVEPLPVSEFPADLQGIRLTVLRPQEGKPPLRVSLVVWTAGRESTS